MALSARGLRELVERLRWVHQGIGVVGGLTFFVGSIFFLYEGLWRQIGCWLFIIGSFGMFIGNLGSVIVRYQIEKSRRRRPTPGGYFEPIG